MGIIGPATCFFSENFFRFCRGRFWLVCISAAARRASLERVDALQATLVLGIAQCELLLVERAVAPVG